jgi:hypothetical protein
MIPGVLNANHMPRISLLRLGFANAYPAPLVDMHVPDVVHY